MLKLSSDIKMVISDFDGVFTDGSLYITEKNEVSKKLNFKDIMGVYILLQKGYKFGIISGEDSNILNYFRENLGIEEIFGGIRQKDIVLQDIMKRHNLKSNEILYIGDDINDICAMELVDYPIAPLNYNPILKMKVNKLQITSAAGGSGAIREICDILCGLE